MRLIQAALIWLAGVATATAECQDDRVDLRGDWGTARFTVEVADTPQARSRGLMFRRDMPRGSGMLFVYSRPQPASFWMKNTLIPLDMIFADRRGVVTHVHANAVPGDLTPINGGNEVFAVLEVNGGLTERYGITVGSEIRHMAFAGGPAVWGC